MAESILILNRWTITRKAVVVLQLLRGGEAVELTSLVSAIASTLATSSGARWMLIARMSSRCGWACSLRICSVGGFSSRRGRYFSIRSSSASRM